MSIRESNSKLSILSHFLGWALFGTVIFILSPLSIGVERPIEFWIKQGLSFTMLVGAFYGNYFFLVRKFLYKNEISKFLVINLFLGIAYILILIFFDNLTNMPMLMHKAFRPDVPYVPRPRNLNWDIYNLLVFAMAVGISTSIAIVQKWQKDEKVRLELQQQQINAELSYLKAQINPHFFFNTLNNIYALANIDIEKSKTALLKLSRMMRYVLYETDKNYTMVRQEFDFIRDYIELMKMRLSKRVKLDIKISENPGESEIAPMLLLPFIENSFKHGISSQHESEISIALSISGNQMEMSTQNSIFKASESTPEGKYSGIGLSNTKRRLDLLYPGKHKLTIDEGESDNIYKVNLQINLT